MNTVAINKSRSIYLLVASNRRIFKTIIYTHLSFQLEQENQTAALMYCLLEGSHSLMELNKN